MGRYLDMLDAMQAAQAETAGAAKVAFAVAPKASKATKAPAPERPTRPAEDLSRFSRLSRYYKRHTEAFEELERRRPERVDDADWHQAATDGRQFLSQWGEEAERLGWTADDLFGLPPIPKQPAWDWHRLARIDQVGLVWLLRGRKVVALSVDQAVIATPSEASIRSASYPRSIQRGTIAFHRRGGAIPSRSPANQDDRHL